MSPEEISGDRGLEVVAVKAALMQNSKKYRVDCLGEKAAGEDPRLNFSDDDLINANETIRHMSKYAEDENLKLKAAMYIRDDKKGRREVAKLLNGNGGINILQINQQLQAARAGAEKIKQAVSGFIDIPV